MHLFERSMKNRVKKGVVDIIFQFSITYLHHLICLRTSSIRFTSPLHPVQIEGQLTYNDTVQKSLITVFQFMGTVKRIFFQQRRIDFIPGIKDNNGNTFTSVISWFWKLLILFWLSDYLPLKVLRDIPKTKRTGYLELFPKLLRRLTLELRAFLLTSKHFVLRQLVPMIFG